MEVLAARAAPALRRIVSGYGQRRANLEAGATIAPLPARADQFLECYLAEPYRVSRDGEAPARAPDMVMVGPQSRAGLRLHLTGTIDVFSIRFQPTGLHRLAGVAMPELVDQGVSAADLLGPGIHALEAALRRAQGFAARVAAADRWLGERLEPLAPADPLDRAAATMLRLGGRVRIEALAERAGLSRRHFTRRFTHEVGLPPKLYARTLRLAAALAAHRRDPGRDWAGIAFDAGYADQAHLIRDCRELAGASPAAFVSQTSNLPLGTPA